MNKAEMLNRLKGIAEPLVSLTAFSDGVICDYISSQGCGGFELCDWSDLDSYNYDSPNLTWEQIDEPELEEFIDRIEAGDFQPLSSISTDSMSDDSN